MYIYIPLYCCLVWLMKPLQLRLDCAQTAVNPDTLYNITCHVYREDIPPPFPPLLILHTKCNITSHAQ